MTKAITAKRASQRLPIRASELVQRRHVEAVDALQRAIQHRETVIMRLVRINAKIWKLGKQAQRYEKKVLPSPVLPSAAKRK